jgi:hypothetical protein
MVAIQKCMNIGKAPGVHARACLRQGAAHACCRHKGKNIWLKNKILRAFPYAVDAESL